MKVFYKGLWAMYDGNSIIVYNSNGFILQKKNTTTRNDSTCLLSSIKGYINTSKKYYPSDINHKSSTFNDSTPPILYTPIFTKHKCRFTKVRCN